MLAAKEIRGLAKAMRIRNRLEPSGPQPMVEWQEDPIGWIVKFLGVPERTLRWSLNPGYDGHAWDGATDPLVAIAEGLVAWDDVGVESGTGTGKSFFLACLALWFLACFAESRVYSYAPKEDQLRLYMWTEIRSLWPRFQRLFPTAVLTDLRIRMDGKSDKWGAVGYAVKIRAGEDSATGAQGAHAPHMLLITEETPGIDPSVMAALENTATAPHNLRLGVGNPDHQYDTLHQFCVDPGVRHVRMSALDHPNVVADDPTIVDGAVSREKVDARRAKYGEDGRLYVTRVRGISPAEAADALVRRVWIEEAIARYSARPELREGLPARGVDVANSEDGDKGAIARGSGAALHEVSSFACPDANRLGSRVAAEMALEGIEPLHVGVDSVGVGAGTVNKLKELGHYVQALNGGERATPKVDEELLHEKGRPVREEEQFLNLRAQMWWQVRVDLQHGRIALPDDDELVRDLLTPTWLTRNGKIVVEPKEKIIERLGRSPDKGDAAVLWNWVRHRAPIEEPEEDLRAWDAEVLEYEADESRRVRTPRPKAGVDPLNLERLG